MFKVDPVEIADEVRVELERRARSQTLPARAVKRARLILLASEGVALAQIARRVGVDQHQVSMWRRRFIAEGLDGLEDRPRSGRPRKIGHDERIRLAAVATSERDPDDPLAQWTYGLIVEALAEEKIEISPSQVGRILNSMDIDLTRVRGWLNRRDDPTFWDRVRDVCGLYLNPPSGALVLSVDEKTSIQARQRKHPDQPAQAGRPARREFEYVRHGTASLHAALAVHSGEVLASVIEGRNNSENFCGFLSEIDSAVDPSLEIHVVLDNASPHTSKHTRAWFANHPRWVVHYTPPHASWVNQIELFFSILQRKVITGGNFSSRDDLINKIIQFICDYDQTAQPFKWTYAADPLVA